MASIWSCVTYTVVACWARWRFLISALIDSRISASSVHFADPQATGTAKGWLSYMNAVIVLPDISLKGHYTVTARVNHRPVKLGFLAV